MLSDEFIKTVGVPSYYTDEYNSTPIANFWCVIERIVSIVRPKVVCEIGSERGITSSMIAERMPDTSILVVDPVVSETVRLKSNVVAYQETSEIFMARGLDVDFYVVDGDHNYETVSMEISRAASNHVADGPFCMLFHDVGWPFARRDGYYSPSSVAFPAEHAFDRVLLLEDETLRDGLGGFENGRSFALAVRSGGDRNGVLTAIEDFVSGDGGEWTYGSIPLFFGLGILWKRSSMTSEQAAALDALHASLDLLRPMLACAEANRLRLHQGLNEHRRDVSTWETSPAKTWTRRRMPFLVDIWKSVARIAGKLGTRKLRA